MNLPLLLFGLGCILCLALVYRWRLVPRFPAAASATPPAEDYFRSFLEQSTDGIILVREDGIIQQWNAGAERIFGIPHTNALGHACWDVWFRVMPDKLKTQECYTAIASEQRGALQAGVVPAAPPAEQAIQRPDGSQCVVSTHYIFIATIQGYKMGCVVRDVTALAHSQQDFAWELKINSAIAELAGAMLASTSIDELAALVLEQAKRLTSSAFGFVGYIDPSTGYLVCPTMTRDIWDVCQVPDKDIVFKTFDGLWGWVLKHRQALLTNTPDSDPRASRNIPVGHISIQRFIAVPALLGDRLIGQIALANAERDYTQHDLDLLQQLAQHYALAMQRKLAEDELRASEERYRLMADNVTDIISRHALDGTYLYASPSCTALLGYTPAELVGRNGSELIHPDDLEPTRAAYAHFSSQISSLVVCYRIRHRDGHYLWLETISKPIYEAASGTVKEILAVSRDITERKRIESELAHSLALQQAIIASSGGGIMVIDHDGAVLSHNREFLHIWGLPDNWLHVTSGDQRLELLARQVLHPERFIARVKELHTRTEAEGYDIIELHDRRLIERYSTPYRVDGHIAGRVWSFRDVTGRQRAAAELRASQNRLQAIFDNTSVGVALLDTRGHYIEMNDRWAQMLRTTPDDIYQTTYLDAVPLDTASEHYAQWQALLQGTAESIQIEQLYHRKDGSKFWGDTSIQAIRGAQQHVEQLVCVVADVTERKRFEEALHYANDQLKVWNGELERHNRDMTTLNDLSELLQRCRTFDEVYAAVEQFIPSLFENTTGALYILQPHTEKVAPVVYWGDEHIWAASITLDTCQALRRGRSVLAETQHDHQRCQHCAPSMHTPTICLPLVAYGEKFGLLTLHNSSLVHVPQARENWQRLAIMVAEHLALTLANLQLREHLQQQAVHDPLTGLFNRRYLKETLESRLHIFEHHRRPVGVIMLDIDHFKQFNDTYGHDGGDTLLRAMGSFLKANTRETDIVCRYGGEEFTLLLPEASPEDTRKRAEQLCEDVRTLCVMHGGKPLGAITISLGVASFPHDGETIEAVVHVADAALLQAKTNGRDQIVMATALSYEAGLGEQLPQSI